MSKREQILLKISELRSIIASLEIKHSVGTTQEKKEINVKIAGLKKEIDNLVKQDEINPNNWDN